MMLLILVSSNLERLLYLVCEDDTSVKNYMKQLASNNSSGEKNGMYNKNHTKETKEKISKNNPFLKQKKRINEK